MIKVRVRLEDDGRPSAILLNTYNGDVVKVPPQASKAAWLAAVATGLESLYPKKPPLPPP